MNNPLLAGIDNISLQTINFDPSREYIESVCRFFSIGKLRHYEKEKGISVAHSSFFVYAATTQGHYALKFYPPNRAKTIAIAYATNLLLAKRHFRTPLMRAGEGSRSFFTGNDLLTTCHSYIDGHPAWQHIKQPNTIHQINTAMLSLKKILSSSRRGIPLRKQASLTATIKTLTQASKLTAPYEQKEMIDAVLLDACRTYQRHRSLFTRQWLHNNITLTNVLICKKTVYVLDLEHVIEDYALADLANLVISCLFFGISAATVKTIIKDHFTQHKIKPEYFPVLNTLIKIELVKEYQKYTGRKGSVDLSSYPRDLADSYMFHLSERVGSIEKILATLLNGHYTP